MFSEKKIQRTIKDNLFPPFFHASEEKKEDEEKEDSEEKETCVSCASKSVTECGAFFCEKVIGKILHILLYGLLHQYVSIEGPSPT